MPGIAIRMATTGDMPAIRALFRAYGSSLAAGPGSICIQNFDREIAGLPSPYTALLLAEVDGLAGGCLALKHLERTGERACEMKRLWVDPHHRGLGLGRRLVVAALTHARDAGCDAIYLDTVPPAMAEANALYASLGFRQVDRYNDNSVAGVVFFRLALR